MKFFNHQKLDEKKENTEFPHKCKMTDCHLDCEGRVLLRSVYVESEFNRYLLVPRKTFFEDLDQLSKSSNTDKIVLKFSRGHWYGKAGSLGHQFKKLIEKWEKIGHNSREHYLSYANISFFFQGHRDSDDDDSDNDD